MPSKTSSKKSSRARAGYVGVSKFTLPDELGPKVARAFHGKRAKWRTLGGIARTTGLSEEVVRDYIQRRHDYFITAPVSPGGKRLYAVKAIQSEYKTMRTISKKAASG